MKQNKKRLVIMTLVCCLLAGLFAGIPGTQTVYAKTKENVKTKETKYGKFQYIVLDDGTVEIDKFKPKSGVTKVIIPKKIAKRKVTVIGKRAFWYCKELKQIEMPDTVTKLKEGAFSNCRKLERIKLSSSLKEIGKWALGDCWKLESIEIPETVESIEWGAFSDCSSLESIKVPNSVKNIGWWVFSRCGNLQQVELPETITVIPVGMFDGCDIPNMKIPDAVTSIGEAAFAGCDFQSIKIPDAVTSIGDEAFEGSDLRSIEISEGVTSIGHRAFYGCDMLTSIEIPDAVTSIGKAAFGDSNIQRIKLPKNLSVIDEKLFEACYVLRSIELPDAVSEIREEAFCGCSDLKNIRIPRSVTKIEKGAFDECSSLEAVYYMGSEEEWNQIVISNKRNDALKNAKVYYNYSEALPEEETIPLGRVEVDKKKYTYPEGKGLGVKETVYDVNGNMIPYDRSSNYKEVYRAYGDVGPVTLTVIGTGKYEGIISVDYYVVPEGTNIKKISAEKNSISLQWKKQTHYTSGYEIEYSTNKNFKKAKSVLIKSDKKVSTTITKLKSNKKYYIRIRTYKKMKIDGKWENVSSKWSKVKMIKTAKF